MASVLLLLILATPAALEGQTTLTEREDESAGQTGARVSGSLPGGAKADHSPGSPASRSVSAAAANSKSTPNNARRLEFNAKHSRRYVTAIRLNRGLQGSPMAGTGWALERAGWRHKVSPYFIAAIAATESSLGRAACRNDRYNAFGLASCTHSWPVPRFRSWAHAYQFMGAFLNRRWPGHTTPWSFRGYAACSDCWARKTAWWMRSLFGVGYRTRYP